MICKIIGGYMLAKTLVVFYVWSPDIFVLIFIITPFQALFILLCQIKHYHTIYRGPPQFSFFAYYMGAPSDLFLRLLYGGPLVSISSLTIWGPPRMSFFAYYMRPPQVSFFAYYMGPPSGQFLRLLYGGPPQINFFAYYMGAPSINIFAHYMGAP